MRPASACSIPGAGIHATVAEEEAIDHTPPTAATVAAVRIERGGGFEGAGSGCTGREIDSCDDVGTLMLQVTASDDRTPRAQLGFRLELVSGSLPLGLVLPAQALRALPDGEIWLAWSEGAREHQEPFDALIQVTPVDLAGNAGPPATVTVKDKTQPGGCVVGGAFRGLSLAWVALAVVAVAAPGRRRRPRRDGQA